MSAPTPRRLQRVARSTPHVKSKTPSSRIPSRVDEALRARAGHRCELCGEAMSRGRCHRHHRKLKSQGGLDELVNLVLIHPMCHNTLHNNPEWARENGFMVSATQSPARQPILLYGQRRVRLTRDGDYLDVAA